jgi:amino acid adenylation domain-containing protein
VLPDPTTAFVPADHPSVPHVFDEHARRAPDVLAVADAERQWTYGDLAVRANRLAHWLRARDVGAGHIVAIHAERNAYTVSAMLGVLKAGAAFLLIDADYPPDRIAMYVRTAKPSAWIDTGDGSSGATALSSAGDLKPPHLLVLPRADAELERLPSVAPDVAIPATGHAYVLFTSGTTGTPKAATATHRALAHFIEWHAATFELGTDERFGALAGLAHAPFVRDVLTPLTIGASSHLPRKELRLEADQLVAWLRANRVTVCHLTPSLARVLTLARSAALPDQRWIFFSGEPLRGELVAALRPIASTTRLVNFYATTETAQAVSYHVIDEPSAGVTPLGHAIDRTQLLVIKDDGQLAAIGEEGEICVRSPYLSSSYLHGDSGGYGTNPFTNDPDDRVYRTGDRGLYRPDASVQILGRADQQVKVRGHRVELGDIEEACRAHANVRHAAVILREESESLAAYVVGDVDTSELLRSLRERLPAYMVPAVATRLDALPLTPNGKIDRRALLALRGKPNMSEQQSRVNDVEKNIAKIWREVLDVELLGRHDNFFDLGGHSLNATQIAARLRDIYEVDVPVRTIFDAPTIAELSLRVVDFVVKAAAANGEKSDGSKR